VLVEPSPQEFARRAQEFYERQLKPVLEPAQNGRYVVINPENGDYAVADTTTEAGAIMRRRYPEQLFYEVRVGHRYVTERRGELLRAADGR
jgi:hypothetical protein